MKTCPNCGEMNGEANDKCYKCGTDLSQISGEKWMYVIAFLIPIVGLVLGCIQVGKNDKTGGKNLIITSIVSFVLYVIVVSVISNHKAKKAEEELSSLYDSYSYSYNIDD